MTATHYIPTNYLDISYIECDIQKVRVSSDWHLYHKNIIQYDNRPFENLEQMHDYIVDQVNSLPIDSILIFLWDLHLGNNDKVADILSRIHCPMYRVLWNHDTQSSRNKLSKYFRTVSQSLRVNDTFCMTHHPIEQQKGKKHLHWHTHKPWLHWWTCDVSYDWTILLYNLWNIWK